MIVITLSGEYDGGSELNVNGVSFDATSFLEPVLYFPNRREEIKDDRRNPPPMPPELADAFPDPEIWDLLLCHYSAHLRRTDILRSTPYEYIFNRSIYTTLPTPLEGYAAPDAPYAYSGSLHLPCTHFYIEVSEDDNTLTVNHEWGPDWWGRVSERTRPWDYSDTRSLSFVNPRFYAAS